jgi:glucose/arabinose dehydrogenase
MTPSLTCVADDLSFPTSVTFDDDGIPLVVESGLGFGGAAPGGRVWRLTPQGRQLVIEGLRPPVSGATFHDGMLYIAEGGHPSRIMRLKPGGEPTVVVDSLPGPGNYHTNTPTFGPDGLLYFGQGAMTNSGIVGLDALELAWLRQLPHAHDVPGYDVVLTGLSFETPNPLVRDRTASVLTGAFAPFGSPNGRGRRLAGSVPCSAGIMRCKRDGSDLELFAWGLRNAWGLVFSNDGRLLATDQGADERGSRPIANAPDSLFHVRQGGWYGWPDFVGGVPVHEERFRPACGPAPEFVLANHGELPKPETPLLAFPPHVAAAKLDVLSDEHPDWPGQLLVALFGDERPMTAPSGARAGRALARIDPKDWSLHNVVEGPLARPIDVRINRLDGSAYVLDFGFYEVTAGGDTDAVAGSGKLWRLEIHRERLPSPRL